MRKIDRIIVIIVGMVIIIALGYGIMRFLEAQKPPPPMRRSIEARRYVKFEPVRYAQIESIVQGPGRLASIAEVDIVAEASGRIQPGKVWLKKGSEFRKGEVLFQVYPDEAILALKARKSQYQNTLAGILPDLSIDYPEAEEAFEDFFSAIRVDRPLPPLPEVQNDQLKVFLASRNVLAEYYSIQRDELSLERRTVRAPFNGTYKEVYLEAGAFTNAGGRVALAIQTDQLELEVPLRREDAAWVRIGDPVLVESASRDLSWKGRVIRISPYVDEGTQSQEVFVEVGDQGSSSLLAGDYLMATFPLRPIKGVMEIPRNAVFNSNEVFVIKNGRLSKQEIHVVKTNERTLLFRGLPEGDSVVVQQLINVSEGTLVQTGQEAPAGPGSTGPGTDQQPEGKSSKKKRRS